MSELLINQALRELSAANLDGMASREEVQHFLTEYFGTPATDDEASSSDSELDSFEDNSLLEEESEVRIKSCIA